MKRGALTARLARALPGPGGSNKQAEPTLLEELASAAPMLPHAQRWASGRADAAGTGDPLTLAEACGAEVVDTPYGPGLVIDTSFPVTSNHGARCVGDLFARGPDAFIELQSLMGDPRLSGFDPPKTIFLDIEASGLRHGAGTYAFVIGLGYLEGDTFVVRQLLLDDVSSEPAALHLLVEHLDRFDYLASFNGKSYDLTVLTSRLIMHRFYTRRDCDLKLRPHLDLLHLSKNLYRGCWQNTKLQTLEREALGFERVDDVPGSLVPSCWYHYLRTGDPRPVREVIRHNLYDVVSMVTLADRLVCDAVEQGALEPTVLVNLGGLLLRRARPHDALVCLDNALDLMSPGHPCVARALASAVTAARRSGNLNRQGALIDRWVDHHPECAAAWTASAIYEERVRKELAVALVSAYRAQALAPSSAGLRRIARLRQRIKKARRSRPLHAS